VRIRSVILAVLFGLGALFAGSAPASAAVDANLGGVDLNSYCKSLGYDGAKQVFPYHTTDWRCYFRATSPGGSTTDFGLSVIGACQYQFAHVVAAGYPVTAVDNGTAGSWRCRATAGQTQGFGGMDLSAYCRSIGYQSSSHQGTDVTGWVCLANDGGAYRLNLHAACAYEERVAVASGWTLAAVWNSFGDWNRIGCQGVHA
jgi:hypothetical protein